jgi:mRNA interferase MazF
MSKTRRGEVWLADLGMAAKVRPVLVLSVPFGDGDYALVNVLPHTTNPRGSQFEVKLSVVGLA